jgi:hypothetical protein
MRPTTEYFGIKAFVGDADRLRRLRDEIQARHPDRIVTMAETFRVCVGSGTAAIVGQLAPERPQEQPPDRAA